jgi:transposase
MPPEGRAETSDDQVVLGVDTHKDVHVAVVLNVLGVRLAARGFPTTRTGYRDMITWVRSHGSLRQAGVEGTGSYGAALTRLLRAEGVPVIEVNRPDRSARRRRGKSDVVDAEAAARAVLAQDATAVPKSADGPVEAMRILKTAKDSAVKARVQAINQLKAVLVSADPALRETLNLLGTGQLVARCAELTTDDGRHDDVTAPPSTRCATLPAESSTSRPKPTICGDASPPRSSPPHRNCWTSAASAPTRPPRC